MGGNPIALSGDGRWLVVAQLNYKTREGTQGVFDAQRQQFVPDDRLPVKACREAWLPVQLVGRAGHPHLYANCSGFVSALDATTLAPVWRVETPSARNPALVVSPDGSRLYGIYPRVAISYASGSGNVTATDLLLDVWDRRVAGLSEPSR